MSTTIEWTRGADGSKGESWNPFSGCSKVSPGCEHCYAERLARRLSGMGQKKYQAVISDGKWNGKVFFDESALEKPLHWKKPRRIFVCSMSDLFHPSVPVERIELIYEVMEACPQHTFIVLTKRPERIVPVLYDQRHGGAIFGGGDYLPNVWHLASCENQAMLDKRVPALMRLRSDGSRGWPVLGVSLEPLLESMDMRQHLKSGAETWCEGHPESPNPRWPGGFVKHTPGISWVIVGSESGPNARPCEIAWVRDIKDQCVSASVPFFWKQHVVKGKKISTPKLDGKSWTEYPNTG